MDDLISRQAVINALEKVAELFPWRVPGNRDTYDRYNEAWNDAIGRAEIEIEALPSAQPKQTASNHLMDLPTSPLLVGKMPSAQPETEERTAKLVQNVPNDDLISRKAAIDVVAEAVTNAHGNDCGLIHSDVVYEVLADVPPAQAEPQWIPCSERLPDKQLQSYWCCEESGYQFECRWTNNTIGMGESDRWGWNLFDIPQYSHVIAWMPLPEPYRGEEK